MTVTEAPKVEWYENEELAREFCDLLGMQLNVHSLMLHVGDVVKRLSNADQEERTAWGMWQQAQISERRGLHLKADKRDKVRKLLQMAADGCEFGRELMASDARHDATLKNWIAEHARTPATSEDLKMNRLNVADTPENRKKLGIPLKE